MFAALLVACAAGAAAPQGCSCHPSPAPAGGELGPAPEPRGPGEEVPTVRRSSPAPFAVGTPPPTVEPMTLPDGRTGITLEFDRDGQHVTATTAHGQVLWHVNPFDTARSKGREFDGRRVWPTIIFAGPPNGWMLTAAAGQGKRGEYVGVAMNTKEGGLLDLRTGEFLSMGND